MATLKRDLGKLSGYATIIGILVGAGIFRVTGEAGAVAGSAVPLAYLTGRTLHWQLKRVYHPFYLVLQDMAHMPLTNGSVPIA